MYTQQDLDLLREKGVSQEQIDAQLHCFNAGFPYLSIVGAASVEKGIMRVPGEMEKVYLKAWHDYLKTEKIVTKFVPASGAASRMFKDLYAFMDADYDAPVTAFEKTIFCTADRICILCFPGRNMQKSVC